MKSMRDYVTREERLKGLQDYETLFCKISGFVFLGFITLIIYKSYFGV